MKTRHSPKLLLKDRERQAEKKREVRNRSKMSEKKREAAEKTDVDLSRKNREREGDRET